MIRRSSDISRSSLRSRALCILALAAAYAVATHLTLSAEALRGGVIAVWPPAGLALAALLRGGARLWPGVLLGALVVKAAGPASVEGALGEAVAATLGALLPALLLRRVVPAVRFDRPRDVIALVGAAALGATVSAVVGVSTQWVDGTTVWHVWTDGFPVWALGDLEGMLLVAPLLLAAGDVGRMTGIRRLAEAVVTIAVLMAAAVLLFRHSDAQLWLLAPLSIWVALRHGVRGAVAASLGLALVALGSTEAGIGPFADGTDMDLLRAQTFAIVSAGMLLVLAAVMEERRRAMCQYRAMAAEDAALRRVATAVAGEASLDEVCAMAGREVAGLLEAEAGVVVRFEVGDRLRVLGHRDVSVCSSSLEEVAGCAAVRDVQATGRSARSVEPGGAQRVAAPIHSRGRLWGAVMACSERPDALPTDVEVRVARFAELVGMAFADAEARARLTAQATTDPLTGLMNHRAFHERLQEHAAGAKRQGTALAVAVFDVDRFKEVNDTLGHLAGDAVLREAGRRMRDAAREGELVARIGGDEFALLLPGSTVEEAHVAAERIRRAATAGPFPQVGEVLTFSAGVADLRQAEDAGSLLALADGALYWAKMHGRDACCVYDPAVVRELSATGRAERLERTRALTAVRALARAIDAKDPATIRHSERVAALAERLAEASGWSTRDVARLRDAALVHDVGKIGVPDAVLSKPGGLSPEEYAAVKRHSELGSRIVAEVLDAEQVRWVRGHHERQDGRGYPDGLAGDAISEGARLLALADTWDAMTRARVYSEPMSMAEALGEVLACVGTQFHPDAVAALQRVYAAQGGEAIVEDAGTAALAA